MHIESRVCIKNIKVSSFKWVYIEFFYIYIRNQILLFKQFEFLELGFIIYRWKRILRLFPYLIFLGEICLLTDSGLYFILNEINSLVQRWRMGWALPTYLSCEHFFFFAQTCDHCSYLVCKRFPCKFLNMILFHPAETFPEY